MTSEEFLFPKCVAPALTPCSARWPLRQYECASKGSTSAGHRSIAGVNGAAGNAKGSYVASLYVAGSNGIGLGILILKTRAGQRSLGGTAVPNASARIS